MRADKKKVAKALAEILQCNCDLDNWEPERETGHSCVCRIHKMALDISGHHRVRYAYRVQEPTQ